VKRTTSGSFGRRPARKTNGPSASPSGTAPVRPAAPASTPPPSYAPAPPRERSEAKHPPREARPPRENREARESREPRENRPARDGRPPRGPRPQGGPGPGPEGGTREFQPARGERRRGRGGRRSGRPEGPRTDGVRGERGPAPDRQPNGNGFGPPRGPRPNAQPPQRGNGYAQRPQGGSDRSGERQRYYTAGFGGPDRRSGDRGRGPRARDRREAPFNDVLKELQQQVSVDPNERLKLELTSDGLSMRALDIIAPIGKGQRCLITAPPKAGKTTLLQEVAVSLAKNHPEVEVIVLLVDERPEEVTHFRRSVPCEVLAASSDQTSSEHVEIAEKALTRVLVPVLEGKDVVLLLDSITRLARAYNTTFQGIGRTMSGGLDAATMQVPRQIFGAARNIEGGGSLTILGTALIETGSRMDEVIFQEFKGTGNMELVLSRQLFERRIFPCIDIKASGTRKEEKLYDADSMRAINNLRRRLAERDPESAMLELLELLRMYPTNELLLSKLV